MEDPPASGEKLQSQETSRFHEHREGDEGTSTCDDFPVNFSRNRTCTDVGFLVVHGVAIIILIGFLGYCIANGDIQRLTKGYDAGGNVCGKINIGYQDMTYKPYLYINTTHRQCVASCYGNTIVQNEDQCVPRDKGAILASYRQGFAEQASRYFYTHYSRIIFICFTISVISFMLLLLLRYAPAAFVWMVIVGLLAVAIIFLIYLGGKNTTHRIYIVPLCLTPTIIISLMLIAIQHRMFMPYVIELFKETGKSIGEVPNIFFESILTLIVLMIVWGIWIYFAIWIESAGVPVVQDSAPKVNFQQNGAMKFTRWYNVIVMLWMVQFVYGCQGMVIGGAISAWFFTRDKTKVTGSICSSTYSMVRYHLGTISVNSFLVMLLQTLQILVFILRVILFRIFIIACICFGYSNTSWQEMGMRMESYTRNVMTITAIHGSSFPNSIKRLRGFLEKYEVLLLNAAGDFFLFMAKILVVIISILIFTIFFDKSDDVSQEGIPMLIVALMAYLISGCIFSVYQMAMDTIIVCFCEDCEMNDGEFRPYFMPCSFTVFAEISKILFEIENDKKREKESRQDPQKTENKSTEKAKNANVRIGSRTKRHRRHDHHYYHRENC